MGSANSQSASTDVALKMQQSGLLQRRLSAVVYIVLSAFLLRLAAMAVVPHTDIWLTAGEMGNIAKALARSQGFSSPFAQPTGATAWVPPAYPFFLGLVFRFLGTFSRGSMLATLLFQTIVATLTC